MTNLTPAERQRRYRERKAGRLPPVEPCIACNTPRSGSHAPLCSRCWRRLTEEGRAVNRKQTAKALAKAKAKKQTEMR
jgi:predicted amidophosphoribosyltransferase